MSSIKNLLSKLHNVVKKNHNIWRWQCDCPAHEDTHKSLSVGTANGRVLLYCFAGCQHKDIVKAIGIDVRNIKSTPVVKQKPVKVWQASYYVAMSLPWPVTHGWSYQHADGSHAFAVYRLKAPHGKEIRPVKPVDGGYTFGLPPAPRPLYRLPEILTSDVVVVCEGEKAADAVVSAGYQATTSVGGASAMSKTDWSPIAEKRVIIWPDNDKAGVLYAQAVREILRSLSPQYVTIGTCGKKGDDAADCRDIKARLKKYLG